MNREFFHVIPFKTRLTCFYMTTTREIAEIIALLVILILSVCFVIYREEWAKESIEDNKKWGISDISKETKANIFGIAGAFLAVLVLLELINKIYICE